jgi:hypothetical protein
MMGDKGISMTGRGYRKKRARGRTSLFTLLFLSVAYADHGYADIVRCDGLYVAADSKYKKPYHYLRFFPDGTVLAVTSSSDAEQVFRWLIPGKKYTSRGHLTLSPTATGCVFDTKSDGIIFTTISWYISSIQTVIVDYKGAASVDTINVTTFSHKTFYYGTEAYHFVPLGLCGNFPV